MCRVARAEGLGTRLIKYDIINVQRGVAARVWLSPRRFSTNYALPTPYTEMPV